MFRIPNYLLLQRKLYENTYKMYDTRLSKTVLMKIFSNNELLLKEYDNLLYIKSIKTKKESSKLQNTLYKTDNAIISDYIYGIDLFDYIVKYETNKSDFYKIMKNVCHCIEYLHKHNVMHLDIKPENFIICEKTKNVTLIDFYSLQNINNNNIETHCGTVKYMSPELRFKKLVYPETDLWSIGIIGFMLATQTHPFDIHGCTYKNIKSYTYEQVLCKYKCDYLASHISKYLYLYPNLRTNVFIL